MRLTARNLACTRNGREIFRGLSFEAGPGDYLELRGPNGAGKTSLLRLLAGLVPRSEGEMAWEGTSADQQPQELCHFVGHQDAVKASLTVRENVEFWAAMLGGQVTDEGLMAFSLQQLAPQPAAILSAGQRRRLALTRLMIAERPLWLLDEPATALDANHLSKLVAVTLRHLEHGGTVIAATHGNWGLKPGRTLTLGEAA